MNDRENGIEIRTMMPEDYDDVYRLWSHVKKLGLRSIDDSRENIVRFLLRNPGSSFVAVHEGEIVGSLLCGHDGRRGCFYHVCVAERFRNKGIATQMSKSALQVLKDEGINKVNLMAFRDNETGNRFWKDQGWTVREDVNLYEMNLNEANVTTFVE